MKNHPILFSLVLLLLAAPVPSQLSAQSVVEGDWMFLLISPQGESEIPLTVTRDGAALMAELSVDVPPGQPGFNMMGTLAGSNVTWTTEVDFQGMPLEINLSGVVDGDEMSGAADYGGMAQGTWSAQRQGD
ncbi:MAG: hypothetical protein WD013_02830 [Gemmatimonadota bacterium]